MQIAQQDVVIKDQLDEAIASILWIRIWSSAGLFERRIHWTINAQTFSHIKMCVCAIRMNFSRLYLLLCKRT
jgi:hypothetical protein